MPGLALGQLYTYPSKRWCKRRRQYLMGPTNNRRPDRDDDNSNTGDNPLVNEDSKDSTGLKDEVSKVSYKQAQAVRTRLAKQVQTGKK